MTIFGILHTPVAYDKGIIDQSFLVMPPDTMEGNIILGRKWMITTKSILDWETRKVTTQKRVLDLDIALMAPKLSTMENLKDCEPLPIPSGESSSLLASTSQVAIPKVVKEGVDQGLQ